MSFVGTSTKTTGSSDIIKSDAQELLDRLHYEVATAAEIISDIMSILYPNRPNQNRQNRHASMKKNQEYCPLFPGR